MSLLPGDRSLARVLPDLDDLLADPRAYLEAAPLAIGPRRMLRPALFFAAPGLALLASCLVAGQPVGERIALGVGLLLGSAVWVGWSLRLRGRELVLHADGVEVISPDGVVRAPWALFRAEDRLFLPESDNPRAGLTLPINPRAVPYVEFLQGGAVRACGKKARTRNWALLGADEVLLAGPYEIGALDLGELFLMLGNRLGKELPAGPPPVDDGPAATGPRDLTRWITLPLTRLRLPPCCARCCGPRDEVVRLPVRAWGDGLLGLLGGTASAAEVPVPLCLPCKEYLEFRQRRGGAVGLSAGAIVCTAAGYVLAGWWDEGRDVSLWLGGSLGLLAGSVAGSVLGIVAGRRVPVRVRRYSPSRGLVSVRFENPEVARRVLEAAEAK